MMISKAEVRRLLKIDGVKASKEIYELLEAKLKQTILDSAKRAKANERKIVMQYDV